MYANHRGCDGARLYFDGSSVVYLNGSLLAQASQFSLKDVEVVTVVVDLNDVRSYRNSASSFQEQSSSASGQLSIIHLEDFSLAIGNDSRLPALNTLISPRIHLPEEECTYGPASWLWDYLRRSGAGGFLLPLRCVDSCIHSV
jgi:NAD+ synthase (glutamine-hydrolysing)